MKRLRAWWRPVPTTPEELEALRAQHEANFDQESRKTLRVVPMMVDESDRKHDW